MVTVLYEFDGLWCIWYENDLNLVYFPYGGIFFFACLIHGRRFFVYYIIFSLHAFVNSTDFIAFERSLQVPFVCSSLLALPQELTVDFLSASTIFVSLACWVRG